MESLERELGGSETRKDPGRIQELLSEEFLEFGSSGKVIRKRDFLESANRPDTTMYQLSDFSFRSLGESHILVTYRSVTSPPQQVAYRSSIWVKENGKWRLLHHQSTVVPGGI